MLSPDTPSFQILRSILFRGIPSPEVRDAVTRDLIQNREPKKTS